MKQQRKARKTRVNLSIPTPLLVFVDAEAEKLCVSRSEYLEFLVWKDFDQKITQKLINAMNP